MGKKKRMVLLVLGIIILGITVFDKGIIINHNKNRANLH